VGNDTMDGGTGVDTASFSGDSQGLDASLASGTANGGMIGNDTLLNFENLAGGSGNDLMTGNAGANALSGAGGNDTLVGGGGNDTLDGGTGIDLLDYSA